MYSGNGRQRQIHKSCSVAQRCLPTKVPGAPLLLAAEAHGPRRRSQPKITTSHSTAGKFMNI